MRDDTRERLTEWADIDTDRLRAIFDALDQGITYRYDGEDRDPADVLAEWPLEVIAEVGRRYAVVLTVGGPDVRIEAEGNGTAYLVARWGTSEVTRWDPIYNRTMDYYIER